MNFYEIWHESSIKLQRQKFRFVGHNIYNYSPTAVGSQCTVRRMAGKTRNTIHAPSVCLAPAGPKAYASLLEYHLFFLENKEIEFDKNISMKPLLGH